MPQIKFSKALSPSQSLGLFLTTHTMRTMKDNTAKRDKIFMILLVVSSIVVISANIAVNFFS